MRALDFKRKKGGGMKYIIVSMLMTFSVQAFGEVNYTESKDDFSNDIVYSLKISTSKNKPAAIFMSCYPGGKLNIQLAINGTMFPDTTSDGGMLISTTHKFDKAENSITSNWFMNMMKYKNSWYQGEKVEFINDAIKSNQLNIRLNKRNDIFKFSLKGIATHLRKIQSKCGM